MATAIIKETLEASFRPTFFSNCNLWLDGSDASTQTLSGTNVTVWRDKSGLENHGTTNGGTTTVSSINSVRALNFNGTSDFTGTISNTGTTMTSFMVATLTGSAASNGRLLSCGLPTETDTASSASVSVLNRLTTTSSVYGTRSGVNTAIFGIVNPFLVAVQYTGSQNPVYYNGTLQGNPAASTGSFGYARYRVGNTAGNGGNGRWGGLVGEIIIYNSSLTTQQRQIVEGYLAWKWGLTATLPENHPYRNAAPSLVPPIPSFPITYPLPTARNTKPLPYFDPRTISGCQLWLDAADTSTITLSGSSLTQWRDKSGTGKIVTINSSPTYSATGFNNAFPTLTFTTTNFLTTSLTSAIGSGDFAFIAVMRNTGTGGQNNVLSVGAPGGGSEFGMGWNNGEAVYKFYRYDSPDSKDNTTANNTNLISIGTRISLSMSIFINGKNPSTTGSSGTNPNTTVYIGAGSGFTYAGQISEIILYVSTITTARRQEIEGYLAWKWGLQANLPTTHPFRAGPPVSVAQLTLPAPIRSAKWLPTQVSGCQLWLDAADPNGTKILPVNGASISTWTDKSGNGRNATAGNAPTLSHNYQNNLPAVIFNGTSTYLNLPNFTSVPISIFMVAKSIVNAGNTFYIALGPSRIMVREIPGSPSYFGVDGSNPVYGIYATSIRDTNYHFWSFCLPASANGFLNIDGTLRSSSGFVAPANTLISANTIGAYNQRADGLLNGAISEIIFYNSFLSISQYQQVEGYLAWKWGLASSLPSTHPYKLFPPSP